MPRKPSLYPALRRHKPSKQGVVTLSGNDVYLGHWPEDEDDPPAEAQARYDREIVEWITRRRMPAPEVAGAPSGRARITIAELLVAFTRHAEQHYRHPDGEPTSELKDYVNTLRPLNHAYGGTPAEDFGPLALKAVRELMVNGYTHPKYGPQAALCRRVVNQRIGRIVRVFKWGVGEELVSETTWRALTSVRGLEKGRCSARESEPVEPVAVEIVEKTVPHLTNHLAGAVRLQLFTGARPGEALTVRLAEIDRTGDVWLYRPTAHKTAYRGKRRVVAIGPKGQAVLKDYIRIQCPLCCAEGRPPRIGSRDGCLCGPCADYIEENGIVGPWQRIEVQDSMTYLFSPAQAMTERDEDRRARRKSKVQPSQVCRKKKKAKRRPGEVYDVTAYSHAIRSACRRADLPTRHPHQLRHAQATLVRRRFGLEAAQVALGHSQAAVTEIYAARDLALAVKVASEIG
jgi:integrase